MFPSLNGSAAETEKWGSLEAPTPFALKILEHCRQVGSEPSIFLSAIWSVLLCVYVDTKVAKIWWAGGPGKHHPESAGKQGMGTGLRAISLADKRTFKELLQRQLWSTQPGSDNDESSNTGILILEASDHTLNCGSEVGQLKVKKPLGKLSSTILRLRANDLFVQNCKILLRLQAGSRQPSLSLSFRTSILSDFHAASLIDTVQQIASAAIENPEQPLGEFRFIGQQDLTRIRTWNAHEMREADCPMHEIIHRRAIDHPQAMAIEAWDGSLTYAELDQMTSHLAAHLMKAGVGPGTFVPLCFEKSVWAVLATLAVNKSGAAFVPLDLVIPIERAEVIIKQSGARIILASGLQAASLRNAGYEALIPSELMSRPSVDGALLPDIANQLNLPAYCLFTSGSTGTPKGCVVSHASFASVVYHGPQLQIRPATRVLQFASFSFGISLIEVYCTLSCGGTTCIPSDTQRLNSLAQAITSMNVEWAIMTPTALDSLSPSEVPTLGTVIVAGEPIQAVQANLWAPEVLLFQAYGLTEWAGIFSVSNPIRPSNPAPNVGFPVNGKAWLVDPNDRTRLQPVGAVAELMIEGSTLAQGYLNNPKSSAASFVLPPCGMQAVGEVSSSHNRRLYATGDLVRYNIDGSIRHMGRKDGQIKIRGQRIEVTEVEFALRQVLPRVKEAVVAKVRTASNGLPSLAAFILEGQGDDAPNINAEASVLADPSSDFLQRIRAAKEKLVDILPSYMIPAILLPLRHSPRTATGKTDRRRLQREGDSLSVDQWKQYTTEPTGNNEDRPLSRTEQRIARIWSKLFRLDAGQIKASDDFLALGGDSSGAMRLVAMARGEGLMLKIADVLLFPRLEDLAQKATISSDHSVSNGISDSANSHPATGQSLVEDSVRRVCISNVCKQGTALAEPVAEVLPATATQQFRAQYSGLDCFTFTLEGEVDLDAMQKACDAVVERHSILRTVLTQTKHGMFQVVLEKVNIHLRHITTNDAISDVCNNICDDSIVGPACQLDQLPTQFTLVSESKTRHALIFRLSQTQINAFCLAIVLTDFASAYDGRSLPPTRHFADYTRHILQQNQTSGYEFWRKYLKGATLTPLGPFTASDLGTAARELSITLKLPYVPEVPAGVTRATLIKACWALIHAQISNQTDIVFGQAVGGRNSLPSELQNIVGACQNYIPIRVHLQATWTVNQYLHHVQEQYLKTVGYDAMDTSKIIQHSTSWDRDAFLPCHHQHISQNTRREVPFQGIRTTSHRRFAKYGTPPTTAIISVLHSDYTELGVRTSSHTMNEEQASSLLERLADILQTFHKQPEMRLAELLTRKSNGEIR